MTDPKATLDAIAVLVRLKFGTSEHVGQRIINDAVYHLEQQLFDYLTGRAK